jgi:hypothetical protein
MSVVFAEFVIADSVIKDNGTGIAMVHANGTPFCGSARGFETYTGVLSTNCPKGPISGANLAATSRIAVSLPV